MASAGPRDVGGGLRVLLVCDFMVRYTALLARGLADRGCASRLLVRDHDLDFGGTLDGGPRMRRYVSEVLDGHGAYAALPGKVSDVRALPTLARVRRDVARFRPDVVHLQDSVLDDPRLLIAAGPRRGRFAMTINDPTVHPGDPVPSWRRRQLWWRLVRHAGVLFVHSATLRDEFRAIAAPSAPVEVVPHGTDLPTPSPLPGAPTLLCFGRLAHYKGVDVLLDALPAVWQRVPEARLIIAGAGDLPAHPVLADDRVELHHRHIADEELPGLFRAARCVVLPYRQASQSGVGSHAKKYARPLVTTAVGGLPELVADGSGLVVAPEDPGALAEALVDVLTRDGLAESMARAAAAGSAATAWPQVAELTLEAYRRHLPVPRA